MRFNKRGESVQKLDVAKTLARTLRKQDDVLICIPYFPESKHDITKYHTFHFDVDWSDKNFKELLRKELTPLIPLEKIKIPDDKITVALHVRKGGGHDAPLFQRRHKLKFPDLAYPLKFPPDSYFIDQLIKLSEILNDKPLYVFLLQMIQSHSISLKNIKQELRNQT